MSGLAWRRMRRFARALSVMLGGLVAIVLVVAVYVLGSIELCEVLGVPSWMPGLGPLLVGIVFVAWKYAMEAPLASPVAPGSTQAPGTVDDTDQAGKTQPRASEQEI